MRNMNVTKTPATRFPNLSVCGIVGLFSVLLGGTSAQAVDFSLENGWQGSLNTNVSLGTSVRAQSQEPSLYGRSGGIRVGKAQPGLGGSNTDSGNLNYDKGDQFSTLLRLTSDLSLSKGEMGMFARVKAWHDFTLKGSSVNAGNRGSNYALNEPLSDDGFELLQKFNGVALLDAYAYNTFNAGSTPIQVRVGNQVVNWGESLFIQGINQINPIDLTALRKPGTELKEAFLPIPSITTNIGLGGGKSIEAFYQAKWTPSNIDSCGTYFGVVETQLTTKSGRACSEVLTTVDGRRTDADPGQSNYSARLLTGTWVPMANGKDGSDANQFGLAFRFPVEAIDAELGLYGAMFSSRTPYVSGYTGSALPSGGMALPIHKTLNSNLTVAQGFWEYPDKIKMFGVTASTNIAGWSVGSELSFIPNQPAQINSGDIIAALLSGAGPYGAEVRAIRDSRGVGVRIPGYRRFNKYQLQVNGIKVLPRMMGSAQSVLVIEGAYQHIDLDELRYGRPFIFGYAKHPTTANLCGSPKNLSPEGCENDGFVTKHSYGYRLRLQLEYPNFAGLGPTLYPQLNISEDLHGYSVDSQFVKDRRTIGVGLRLNFQKRHNLELNYVTYSDKAKYDAFRDRDFYSLVVSTSF